MGEVSNEGSPRRAEENLLLACCSCAGDRQRKSERFNEISRLISDGIDWSYFSRLASWHCEVPRAYRVLRDNFPGLVPRHVLEQMGKDFAANALRNHLLSRELIKLMALLEENGVIALTLKGPTLALATQGDITIRQFGDLDILVDENAFPAAAEALELEGYRARRFRKGKKTAQHFLDLEDEFVKPGSFVLLDVHWSLLPRSLGSFLPYDELLRSSVIANLLGTNVRTLAPSELLLFLAVHGAKHGWKLLAWVSDIAELITAGHVDLEHVFDLARRLRYGRALSLALLLAADMLEAPVEEKCLSALRGDRIVVNLVAGISARMFRRIEARPTLYQDWLVPFRLMEGATARWRYLSARAFTPSVQDRELIDLGRLYPLYLLIRPFRLVWEQGPRLLGRRIKPDVIPSASRPY